MLGSYYCSLTDEYGWSYPEIYDGVNVPNGNAELLSAICLVNSMVVVNNLKYLHKHFPKNKTYRRRGTWVSETDTCIVSRTMVSYINILSVLQRDDLALDHSPITVKIGRTGVDLNSLLSRTTLLGDHSALYDNAGKLVEYHGNNKGLQKWKQS